MTPPGRILLKADTAICISNNLTSKAKEIECCDEYQ